MFPEEKGYVTREFERLDDLYCHLMEGDTDKTFYLVKETLDYAKKKASYFDANFDETSGIVRLYINGCGMTIIYTKTKTSFVFSVLLLSFTVHHFSSLQTNHSPNWRKRLKARHSPTQTP